ncbi:uncharacterized protein LOC117607997 isoform X1 [Osmia lignaria lignaria]|uniref:uncharacterized protein LOC117607997 isoform X1 n=2 Tax=Osmia lignaria lignaria TaxID=1437193 RepID=UPI00402BDC2B
MKKDDSRNEMYIERCRRENRGAGKLNSLMHAERSTGVQRTEANLSVNGFNISSEMFRFNDLRTIFFLLLAIQLQQFLPHRQGMMLTEARMEVQFAKCCGLGTAWAMEGLGCEKFSGPVPGVPTVEQGLCLEAVDICCVRAYHEQQCKKGKSDARAGLACVTSTKAKRAGPGDYHRDCCEACKLGILTGSMGQGCAFKSFNFGNPWDPAFLECCHEASPSTTTTLTSDSTNSTSSSDTSETESSSSSSTFSISSSSSTDMSSDSTPSSPSIPTPPLDDICQLMKGLLCSDICVPTQGSYYCKCREGFTLLEDGKTCRQNLPTDRCKSTNPCEQRCTDNGVAVICSCNPGYVLANDKRSCIPKSSENKTTVPNEGDEFSALCPAGYRYNATNQVCDDVNECIENGVCSGRCENTIGSYICATKNILKSLSEEDCPPGYEWESIPGRCTDIDECLTLPKPCPEQKNFCVNTQGSFSCLEMKGTKSCPAGFKFDKLSQQCKDVDECAEAIHSCIEGTEQCRNTEGAYECDVKCTNGFIYNVNLGTCVDIDECSNDLSNCGKDEQCINFEGGHRCSPLCSPGFELRKNDKYFNKIEEVCEDINECVLGLHSCDASTHYCVNTKGSYSCEVLATTTNTTANKLNNARNNKIQSIDRYQFLEPCKRGYARDLKNGECMDIDECTVGPGCRDHEQCNNTPGGYDCSPLCTSGWYFSPSIKGCQDVDECLIGRHDCPQTTHKCVNTNGSFYCQLIPPCDSGFKRTFDGSCVDIDECLENLHSCRLELHQYCVNRNGSFECVTRLPSCQSGYEYSLPTGRCEDIDECVTGQYKCDTRIPEKCVNLPGSYRCERSTPSVRQRQKPACPSGFRYHPRLRKCTDIDECAEGLDSCEGEVCYNQPGGYSCAKPPRPATRKTTTTPLPMASNQKCVPGTKFVRNRGCVDVDECREVEDACSSNEECVNTMGSYTCNCKVGFKRENLTQACVDINECQTQEDSCLPTQRCDNTIGSYTCTRFLPCGTGYTLNAATEICEDDDECLLGTHDCGGGYHCRNTLGSYRCDRNPRVPVPQSRIGAATTALTTTTTSTTTSVTPVTFNPQGPRTCPRGFQLVSGGKCVDIDECQKNPNPCGRTMQRCINTLGSYRCVSRVLCSNGYTLDPVSGQYCVDIDECADGTNECTTDQTCENRLGGYVCTCPPGYVIGPNKDCVDIDECSLYGNVCGPRSQCENTVGSYHCKCESGFESIGGFGGNCQDVDECSQTPGLCQHTCFNVWGSYRCICKPGFRLNPDNRSCTDIDECSEFKSNNLCVGICENTPGSYACKCPDGYKLGLSGRTCEDIDECRAGHVCRGADEICHNTRGGYRCNKINCPSGYHQDHERKNRCVRSHPCYISDAACFRSPSHYSYNFITLVSMLPISSNKPEELFKMKGYHLPTSTIQFSMTFLEARAPPGVQRATESCFALKRPAPTQAVLVMTRSIQGPQEIELDLNMEVYHNTIFAGSAVAKILIFVSQYEF